MKFHGNLTKEEFWREWFGPLGRELVGNKSPRRDWTDNPDDLIAFIKMCESEHEGTDFCRPCWISSQPMRCVKTIEKDGFTRHVGEACGIEKLFFDFDDDSRYCSKCDIYIKKKELIRYKDKKKKTFCPKCDTECIEKPRLDVVGDEVKKFIKGIKEKIMIVKTRKGYHVYIFLQDIKEFSPKNYEFAKKVYEELQKSFIDSNIEYNFMDGVTIGDLMRAARVPLTMHEKTGERCLIVDRNLNPTKIRELSSYRTYGITSDLVKQAVATIKKREYDEYIKKKEKLDNMEEEMDVDGNGFKGTIRPCFQRRMDNGYMDHPQRLAWLSEIYYAGYDTEEKMLNLCEETFNDFKKSKSLQQIRDYFSHKRWNWKPYRCSTIIKAGWCLKDDCPIWKHQKKKKAYT